MGYTILLNETCALSAVAVLMNFSLSTIEGFEIYEYIRYDDYVSNGSYCCAVSNIQYNNLKETLSQYGESLLTAQDAVPCSDGDYQPIMCQEIVENAWRIKTSYCNEYIGQVHCTMSGINDWLDCNELYNCQEVMECAKANTQDSINLIRLTESCQGCQPLSDPPKYTCAQSCTEPDGPYGNAPNYIAATAGINRYKCNQTQLLNSALVDNIPVNGKITEGLERYSRAKISN